MTAVNWLEIEIKNEDHHTEGELGNACIDVNTLLMLVKQAREMEKQQIIDAFKFGEYPPPFFYYNAEQYYNETYGSKGSDERIVESNKTINSQTEISDEEIQEEARQYTYDEYNKFVDYEKYDTYNDFINGAKWYREQLKTNQ